MILMVFGGDDNNDDMMNVMVMEDTVDVGGDNFCGENHLDASSS